MAILRAAVVLVYLFSVACGGAYVPAIEKADPDKIADTLDAAIERADDLYTPAAAVFRAACAGRSSAFCHKGEAMAATADLALDDARAGVRAYRSGRVLIWDISHRVEDAIGAVGAFLRFVGAK